MSNNTYKVNLFPFPSPHQTLGESSDTESTEIQTTGVCFSGGGSRALSAAMGQMRGLTHLGLMQKTQFISGVSGGAWASSVYSYVPESISDDDLLGGVCENPADLTWDKDSPIGQACELDYLPPNNIGALPGKMSIAKFLEKSIQMYKDGVPSNEFWVRLVGEYVFQPYGLYTGYGTSKYFTWNKLWFDALIKPHNPNLNLDDFYCYPQDRHRPNLLVFGSMFPTDAKDESELLPIMFSPYFSGVIAEFKGQGQDGQDIGGGGVDSFGFNSQDQSYVGVNLQQIDIPANKFSLADMAGISSSFFAEIISAKHPEFDSMIPEYDYWPVLNPDSNTAKKYRFADGGNLDNSGVASMLRQRTKNIISFLNTSVPLAYDHELLLVMVDNQVPPLFGYQPYTKGKGYVLYKEGLLKPEYGVFSGNQVFESDQFYTYINTLWNASVNDGPALCYQPNLTVLANKKFGVFAGKVNMLWVYNNPVKSWLSQLSWEVKLGMDADPLMWSFPNYPTANIGLTARQVNLLAHLSCWNIISDNAKGNPDGLTNKQMFKRMY